MMLFWVFVILGMILLVVGMDELSFCSKHHELMRRGKFGKYCKTCQRQIADASRGRGK
jgi:hypothetical protein